MLQVGNKVRYRDMIGEIKQVMNDMLIVGLPDGKDYSLPYDAVTLEGEAEVLPPMSMHGIMTVLRPHIKKLDFLTEMAKVMSESGVNELHIKSGAIQTFLAKESLEERMARYTAEAVAEAKARAEADHATQG